MSTTLNDSNAPILSTKELMRQNLTDFLEANRETDTDFYKARHELTIARYALSQQLEVYAQTLSLLKALLKRPTADIAAISSTITMIEDKSQKLMNSVNTVTRALKMGAEIENLLSSKMDGVQVYAILSQLPTLLENILLKATNDPVLSQLICNDFNNELSNLTTLTVTDNTPKPVVEETLLAMLSSVPDSISDASPEEARMRTNLYLTNK